MSKKELSYTEDEFSQFHPVPENQLDLPQQQILFSVSGQYFQRFSPVLKENFPQLIPDSLTQTRQARLVAITDRDGYGLSFQTWDRDTHGEFEDIEKCPLQLQDLQDLLQEVALDTDQSINVFATYQDLSNARKRSGGSSTKAVPKK